MPKVTSRRAGRRSARYDYKVNTTRTMLPVHYGVIERYDTGEKKREVLRQKNGLVVTKTYFKNGAQKEEEWKLGTTVHRLDGPALTIYDKDGKKIHEEWYIRGEKQPDTKPDTESDTKSDYVEPIDSSVTLSRLSRVSPDSNGSYVRTTKMKTDIEQLSYLTHPVKEVSDYMFCNYLPTQHKWNLFKENYYALSTHNLSTPIKDIQLLFINFLKTEADDDDESKKILNLFNFIINGKRLVKPIHVFRGDANRIINEAMILKNTRFDMDNFISTSVDMSTASRFGSLEKNDFIFDIRLERGFPIQTISTFEFEVLLPPLTTLVIDKIDIEQINDVHRHVIARSHLENWEYILEFRDKVNHKKFISELKLKDEQNKFLKTLRRLNGRVIKKNKIKY